MRKKEPWKPVLSLPENELILAVLGVPAAADLLQKGFDILRFQPFPKNGWTPVLVYKTDRAGHLDQKSVVIWFEPEGLTMKCIVGKDRLRSILEDQNALFPEKSASRWKRFWRVFFPSLTD